MAWKFGAVAAGVVASLICFGTAAADPFADGLAAAQRGDFQAAASAYRQAADQGNADAKFILGVMYANGQGVIHNEEEAARLYLAAAQHGVAAAQYSVAVMYRDGRGIAHDDTQATLWFKKAAEDTDISASEDDNDTKPAIDWSGLGGVSIPQDQFRAQMDGVFGAGRWRETGGYRSPAMENQLRAEGAMTVQVGHLSRHSLGTRDAPGAYDVVVIGMSPYDAAAILRRSGAPFAKLLPETTHGTQGAHLHIEPVSFSHVQTIARLNR
jgi:hypothetical protein